MMKTKNLETRRINFKNVKKWILTYLSVGLFTVFLISCSKDNPTPADQPIAVTGAGSADIILTAGGQEFKLSGPCGWASAGGVKYIGANHATNNLKVFGINFNIAAPPNQTTTYQIVDNDSPETPGNVSIYFSEISGNNTILTEWSSKDTSGTVKIVVEGNKCTVNLTGITLYPQTSSIYINGNVGAFANPGSLKGTLIFYK